MYVVGAIHGFVRAPTPGPGVDAHDSDATVATQTTLPALSLLIERMGFGTVRAHTALA